MVCAVTFWKTVPCGCVHVFLCGWPARAVLCCVLQCPGDHQMCMCMKAEGHVAELSLALSYRFAWSGLWASKPQALSLSEADQVPGSPHPVVTSWERPFDEK